MMAKIRPKFDKVNWNGMNNTFRAFKNTVEGHLLQTGASYLFNKIFLGIYKELGDECLKSDVIWKMFKVSHAQAVSDKEFLFGILVSCTTHIQHKIIIKYKSTQNGILAWDEFKKDFEFDGSKELKQEQLETMVQQPYKSSDPGGMAAYIDKFQSLVAQLEAIAPQEYFDTRKKRTLLTNIRSVQGVFHLIQKCSGEESMTFDMSATYLRKNAMYIDHVNSQR